MVWVIAIVLLALSGCKKEYTCGYSYYYNPAYVAFNGFTAEELTIIIVSRYTGNDSFSNLIRRDTLDGSSALFEGDTAYGPDNYGFFTVAQNVDFKIQLPKAGREFLITDVRQFESGHHWVQDDRCGSGSQPARIRSLGFKVDGVEYVPVQRIVNNWYIFLDK